jgi:hypothetical protein
LLQSWFLHFPMVCFRLMSLRPPLDPHHSSNCSYSFDLQLHLKLGPVFQAFSFLTEAYDELSSWNLEFPASHHHLLPESNTVFKHYFS